MDRAPSPPITRPTMSFTELGLPEPIAKAAADAGYTQATPIQAEAIPILLAGHDLVGCSRTGSGKTAAFAMPLLAKVDLKQKSPQVLVLCPTRELAVQVADAFVEYGAGLSGLNVLAVFGGAAYAPQVAALRRGVHVVVGTPGRLIDQIKQEALSLAKVHSLVLDEADEMLRMGFIDDVRWILEQVPAERQIALFSATMPEPIREIADRNLRDPKSVTVDTARTGATTTRQEHVVVSPRNKIEVLCRLLEVEKTDGVIVFVKTKMGTVEVADRLIARGFNAAALNGDIAQAQRQRTVDKLKASEIDILVATDVAARGLDVDRVSHVFNFDLPHDQEAYIHRVGRTGRAGREGAAILLVTPSQRRVIRSIEKAAGQTIAFREQPPVDQINAARSERFKAKITEALQSRQLETLTKLITEYCQQTGEDPTRVAAALAVMTVGDRRFFARPLEDVAPPAPARDKTFGRSPNRETFRERQSGGRDRAPAEAPREFADKRGRAEVPSDDRFAKRKRHDQPASIDTSHRQRYRLEIGKAHGIQPGQLFAAIANQTGLSGEEIGRIRIMDDFTIVDLPDGMPPAVFEALGKTRVAGHPLKISRDRFATKFAERKAPPAKKKADKKHEDDDDTAKLIAALAEDVVPPRKPRTKSQGGESGSPSPKSFRGKPFKKAFAGGKPMTKSDSFGSSKPFAKGKSAGKGKPPGKGKPRPKTD